MKITKPLFIFLLLSVTFVSFSQTGKTDPFELNRYKDDYSNVHVKPAQMNGAPGIAVLFEGTESLHYYARAETATAPGNELQVKIKSDKISFGKPVFPKWKVIKDPFEKDVEVYAGNFNIFVPVDTENTQVEKADIEVEVYGQACTDEICLMPAGTTFKTSIDLLQSNTWPTISIEEKPKEPGVVDSGKLNPVLDYTLWYALGLAFIAGLSLNIMPCVWPVLPLVVLRIVEQAKNKKSKKLMLGITFCFGIVLFFACLAIANIILNLTVGAALQWGDQFRNPIFVTVMSLVLVVLALFMFDVFTFIVPVSVSGKSSSSGYAGTIGMGFLAAILSTPCSFGILAAVIAWAQGQPLVPATLAILTIGLGMGTPYIVLTAIPGLLEKLPKPGTWMEIFKKFVGFVLLGVAVWMITVLPQQKRASVLYYALIIAFSVWMWGGWVSFNSKTKNKIIVRALAIALALAGGFYFLKPSPKLIDWQEYDRQKIETAKEQGQPVLIKFTADWCISCKVVEKVVYNRKDIADLIEQKGVLAVKADTTLKESQATTDLQEKYMEAVPFSVLILPDEKEYRWLGKAFGDELKGLLEEVEEE